MATVPPEQWRPFSEYLDQALDLPEADRAAWLAALASGRSADGEHFARQLLAVTESVARGPDTSADVGEALLLLAKAEIAQGRAGEAQPLLDRAARCLANGLGADHALTREALALATHEKA